MKLLKTLYYLNCWGIIRNNALPPRVFKKGPLFLNKGHNRMLTYSEVISRDNYFVFGKNDSNVTVLIIPMFKDNYSYIFFDKKEEGIVVDPSDYSKVESVAKKENVQIQNVLCTHKHLDHSAGNEHFLEQNASIYGIKDDGNPYINKNIIPNKEFQISSFTITTFISNFHATNHVSYLVKNINDNSKQLFFTGDFLFSSGIGRNFERNNEDLYNSINVIDIIEKNNTYVFCGHEYTTSNLQFALTVDSDNDALKKYYEDMQLIRKQGKPTIPTLLLHEYLYNPFLRYQENSIKRSVEQYAQQNNIPIQHPMDYLVILRQMKDNFVAA